MSAIQSAAIAGRAEAGSPSSLLRARNIFAALGIVGVVVGLNMAFSGATSFFESWLYAFLTWFGAALGCFVLLTVVHMAGGSWGAMIMRPLEAGVATLPLLAVLFIPLLFGIGDLYPWSDPAYGAAEPLVGAKAGMLNTPFFIVRSILYFVIFILGGTMLLKGSDRADGDPSGKLWMRLKGISPAWLAIYIMVMTFAAFDWGMSLTPAWFSGIYPTILMAGQAVMGMALMILFTVFLAGFDRNYAALLTAKRLQDLGNFLMAFLMFWAYVHVSQLMIIWSNNTMETSGFYVSRLTGGWEPVSMLLVAFGFFAPFVILFSRWVKQKRFALTVVALWAVAVRMLDMYWLIIPSFGREGAEFRWLDIILMLGMGGIWVAYFLHRLASRPLLPGNDPRLKEAGIGH